MENVKVTAGLIFRYAYQHKMRIDNPVAYAVVPRKKQTVEEIENGELIKEKFLNDMNWKSFYKLL